MFTCWSGSTRWVFLLHPWAWGNRGGLYIGAPAWTAAAAPTWYSYAWRYTQTGFQKLVDLIVQLFLVANWGNSKYLLEFYASAFYIWCVESFYYLEIVYGNCKLAWKQLGTLGDNTKTKRVLNNGLSQGSVLSPILFNMYLSDITETRALKCMYTDDIALTCQWETLYDCEQTL